MRACVCVFVCDRLENRDNDVSCACTGSYYHLFQYKKNAILFADSNRN